jgi:phosphodiesterase/alkaline phosphatase D-like protein
MMGAKQKAWFKKELLDANGKYPIIFWVSSVPWIGTAGTNYYPVKTNVFGYIHHTKITDEMRRRPRHRDHAQANDDPDTDPADDEEMKDEDDATDTGAHQDNGSTNRRRQPRFPFGEDHWSVFSRERREIADFVKANHIRGLCILHGDSHMLAADDGSHSDYATGGGAPLPVMCAAPLDQRPSLKGGPYSQGVYRVRPDEGCFGLVTVTDNGTNVTVNFSGRNNQNEEKIALKFIVPAN